ncbi:MAG TPA: acyl carrier protein [Blastocatellia bacterium]
MQDQIIINSIRNLMVGRNLVADENLTLTGSTRLIDELGLDSITMLELITAVEEEFDITIDFEELDIDVLNVASSFASLINDKIAGKDLARRT